MTQRERTSLILAGVGAFGLVVAAVAYGGWVLGLAVASLLVLIAGFALGLDTDEGDTDPDFMTPSFLDDEHP